MNTLDLYGSACSAASAQVVRTYSTSFGWAIRTLHPRFRGPIRAIYGFVRCADEIVDTFHDHDQRGLLDRFAADTRRAIAERISLNPVLHSFQATVHRYGIDGTLIGPFLASMRTDLDRRQHDPDSLDAYIFGSAEVVGLMCLKVFCEGDKDLYERLAPAARRLGAAFQKVNFLRDLQDDNAALGRHYFPGSERFDAEQKRRIEQDIEADFRAAASGIRDLPRGARFGVHLAYAYYRALLRKIRLSPVEHLLAGRIRLHNRRKLTLLTTTYIRHGLGLLRWT